MDPILELLNRLAAAATDEDRAAITVELNEALAALSDEELAEVLAGLTEQMAGLREQPRTPEIVGQMQTLRDGILAARADTERRETEQAELDAEAERILAEVTEPETPAEGEEAETPAEQTPEAPGETTPPAEAPAQEAVAASASPRRRVPLSTLARNQTPGTEPAASTGPTRQGVPLVASVSGGGVQAGAEVTDRLALGRLFSEAHRNLGRGKDRLIVASGVQPHGPEVTLGDDPVVNEQRIEAAVLAQRENLRTFLQQTPEAMVAAGGFCGLPTPIYTEPSYAQPSFRSPPASKALPY